MGTKSLPILLGIAFCTSGYAQGPFASPSPSASAATPPFRGFGDRATGVSDAPPREIRLVEKNWNALSNTDVSKDGKTALAIDPAKWKHAETENFIIHFRRVTEAQKVAREIEYDLWFVATALGAARDRYQKKSHVFVFANEAEWTKFVPQTNAAPWSASFASGDELFLNVRADLGDFDSQGLAHETTHAVVARLYPRQRWPVWLNEGFAEHMGTASVASRKNQTLKRHERTLSYAKLSLDQLTSLREYPKDMEEVRQLYETSEKLVRFLMTELPKDRFPKFIDAVLAGDTLQNAVLKIYGDQLKNWDAFMKKFDRFSK